MDADFIPEEITYDKVNRNAQKIYLSDIFEQTILLHIIGNYLDKPICPRFLAIEGAMGEGKSVQTLYTCLSNDIHVYYFSGAELSGGLEAESREKLEKTYNYLKNHMLEGEFYVIIIDDFHLSVASTYEKTTNTVNSQLLTGYLMELADETKVKEGKRIPIILIANNFENLHSPLMRDGRMDFFRWEPKDEEKKLLIKRIYSNFIQKIEVKKFEKFITTYIKEPISFFSEILYEVYKADIKHELAKKNYGTLNDVINVLNKKYKTKISINVDMLQQIVNKRKLEKPKDYLKEGS